MWYVGGDTARADTDSTSETFDTDMMPLVTLLHAVSGSWTPACPRPHATL